MISNPVVPMLYATCRNCKTIEICSYDRGATWTHMPMNATPCWIVRPGSPEDAVATPWMQGE
jgi:hypothetical protein